ncbi:hypothetical protein BGZ98_000521 [Dissophora globulifera]|nr:hypothetical protein BGZ98_000521 [Dissophora globulifera]
MSLMNVRDFGLPIPAENTNISISINTGRDRGDTDYEPLNDIQVQFNQEFRLPAHADLKVTLTVHLMQAPHLLPRSLMPSPPVLIDAQDAAEDSGNTFLGSNALHKLVSKTGVMSKLKGRKFVPTLFQREPSQNSSEGQDWNSSTECPSETRLHPALDTSGYASGSDSSASKSDNWRSRLAARLDIDVPSSTTSVSSLSSSEDTGMLSTVKNSIKSFSWNQTSISRQNMPFRRQPREGAHSVVDRWRGGHFSGADLQKYTTNCEIYPMSSAAPVPLDRQKQLQDLRQTETSLQFLSRHIEFEDELCVARSGSVAFSSIKSVCENQIVPVEFGVFNNWVDLQNYSTATSVASRSAKSSAVDDGSVDLGTDGSTIATIETLMCFIPGPELDLGTEEDEENISTEPQNLLDCEIGLKYFHWQEQTTFQGELFFLTEQNSWKEGWFRITGSKLWQCRTPDFPASVIESTGDWEMVRCLDLGAVQQIETEHGTLQATARYLDIECQDRDGPETSNDGYWEQCRVDHLYNSGDLERRPFFPVRNGFRLRLSVSEAGSVPQCMKMATQDFYAESHDTAQAWCTALIRSCRDRPLTPHWMDDRE